MERQNIIKELTEYELTYLLTNSELLTAMTNFFAKGGFNSYTDEELVKAYDLKLKAD